MKIALVHEWLTVPGGSESCFKELAAMFPEADIFALVSDDACLDKLNIASSRVKTTFIQRLPSAKTKWKRYLPLFPMAIESLDLSKYDVIISSSHAAAKGVITGGDQIHICYIYSPVRYAWDLCHRYLVESGLHKGLKGWLAKYMLHKFRLWDVSTANRVDEFIPISKYIERRVWRVYHRKSYRVVYPPVAVNDFTLLVEKGDFYLAASRLVPYKRLDLIVQAFASMPDKKLVVIGDGPDLAKVRRAAEGFDNINVMGFQGFDVLRSHMQRAKAFIFAADEDFGIIPIEAQACGTPVIAYGKGGSLETVKGKFSGEELSKGDTGVYFNEQSVSAIQDAVKFFEENCALFDARDIRKFALGFSEENFRRELKATILEIIEKYSK